MPPAGEAAIVSGGAACVAEGGVAITDPACACGEVEPTCPGCPCCELPGVECVVPVPSSSQQAPIRITAFAEWESTYPGVQPRRWDFDEVVLLPCTPTFQRAAIPGTPSPGTSGDLQIFLNPSQFNLFPPLSPAVRANLGFSGLTDATAQFSWNAATGGQCRYNGQQASATIKPCLREIAFEGSVTRQGVYQGQPITFTNTFRCSLKFDARRCVPAVADGEPDPSAPCEGCLEDFV